MYDYNKILSFSFSPIINQKNNIISEEFEKNNFLKNIVITEKLDNCIVLSNQIDQKSFLATSKINSESHIYPALKDLEIHGKYIKYNKESVFHISNIIDNRCGYYLSYKELEYISNEISIPLIPIIYRGSFDLIGDLQKFLDKEIDKESFFGGPRRGLIVKTLHTFHNSDFNKVVAKYTKETP